MNKPKQLIIIGGGSSIKGGINNNLWNRIKNSFTIALNYSYKYFNSTVIMYIDKEIYTKNINELKNANLIIGRETHLEPMENTIYIATSNVYSRNLWTGLYKSILVGIMAISLGIYLLDEGEIFLLGYDWGTINNELEDITDKYEVLVKNNPDLKRWIIRKNGKIYRKITHFYKKEHRGTGKINYYNLQNQARIDLEIFKQEKKVKIWNVSPQSNIPDDIFEKINYKTFFEKLDNIKYNQTELKNWIIKRLNESNVSMRTKKGVK